MRETGPDYRSENEKSRERGAKGRRAAGITKCIHISGWLFGSGSAPEGIRSVDPSMTGSARWGQPAIPRGASGPTDYAKYLHDCQRTESFLRPNGPERTPGIPA